MYAAGGSLVISDIATQPGASSTLISASVPYGERAMQTLLGFEPEQHCSALSARNLALKAYIHGLTTSEVNSKPSGTGPQDSLFGLGVTAALRSLQPKRGEHRAFVAVQTTERTIVWHLPFEKGALTRLEEERQLADRTLSLLEVALDLAPDEKAPKPLADQRFSNSLAALFNVQPHQYGTYGNAVLPGSFNPIHAGHRRMKGVAEQYLDTTVSYELSIRNVDKPTLDYIDIAARIDGFKQEPFVLTNQPTFVEKAELLFSEAGGTFVVGTDTVQRIDQKKYYGDSKQARNDAIARLLELNVHFLVFGRLANGGDFHILSDLTLGSDLRSMCTEVPEGDFREDISSTELRDQQLQSNS